VWRNVYASERRDHVQLMLSCGDHQSRLRSAYAAAAKD